ncbi:hypothetical protein J7E71_19230 [Mesobacillus foraminis]|nr:hypothetical protein [Mesobacillus foraminis]MBT2758007.1 hypothetical protein [Mesobacillus foraminis]
MEKVAEEMICSKCNCNILDEAEFMDNDGVCDECYSFPIKKRRGLK